VVEERRNSWAELGILVSMKTTAVDNINILHIFIRESIRKAF
jgi:hypothetical protein